MRRLALDFLPYAPLVGCVLLLLLVVVVADVSWRLKALLRYIDWFSRRQERRDELDDD